MQEMDAWSLEERFWLEGPEFYKQVLHSDCLMVFPGIGIMRAVDVLESLQGAPRWSSVKMNDRAVARHGTSAILLGYKAEGRREGSEPYRAPGALRPT